MAFNRPNQPNGRFNNQRRNKNGVEEPLINEELRLRDTDKIRLVYKDRKDESNNFSEVMSYAEARNMSMDMEMDLIEVNLSIEPPVIRLDSYDKFLWDLKKSQKDKKKPTSTVKEIQLSTNISLHDMETKANKAKEFIADGDRVKVVLRMRGRELGRREQSKESLRTFIGLMSDVAVIDGQIREEGNRSVALLRKK